MTTLSTTPIFLINDMMGISLNYSLIRVQPFAEYMQAELDQFEEYTQWKAAFDRSGRPPWPTDEDIRTIHELHLIKTYIKQYLEYPDGGITIFMNMIPNILEYSSGDRIDGHGYVFYDLTDPPIPHECIFCVERQRDASDEDEAVSDPVNTDPEVDHVLPVLRPEIVDRVPVVYPIGWATNTEHLWKQNIPDNLVQSNGEAYQAWNRNRTRENYLRLIATNTHGV